MPGMFVEIASGMDWRVRTAIDVMLGTIDRPLAVTDLARRVNLSRSRFTHLFRADIGCSPARYLREARLDRARQLLEDTALSIKEIMFRVGFNDPSHFTRDFARRYGASPRTFRARIRSPEPAARRADVPLSRSISQLTGDPAKNERLEQVPATLS
jgi:transcriptional regulator GlxA family with amidase domain